MSNVESITVDDLKILSESIEFYRSRDLDHSLNILRKVSNKYEENKNKSKNNDNGKSKTKTEDFKSNLMIIANKFKSVSDTIDKSDTIYVKLSYNLALLLHFMQQTQQSAKVLDQISSDNPNLDSFSVTNLKLLMAENFLNNQSYSNLIQIIQTNMESEDFRNLSKSDVQNHLLFLFSAQIMMKKFTDSLKTLSELNKHDYPLVKMYESQYNYYLWDIPESLTTLTNVEALPDRDMACFWNNISCIHFHLCKFNLAVFYCNRALNLLDISSKKSKPSHSINPSKISTFGRPYEIIQNLGVEMLFANKPVDAFDLLLEVVNIYPKNPRLWLRLAECCVRAFTMDDISSESKSSCVQNVVGTGIFKKVILRSDRKEYKRPLEEVAAMPTPTLEFASLCIRNALSLLPSQPDNVDLNAPNAADLLVQWYKDRKLYVKPSGNSICGMDIFNLQMSLYLTGSYIALCLDSPVEASRMCEYLLAQPASLVSPYYRYLARNYSAEALAATTVPNNTTQNWNQIVTLLEPNTIKSISHKPELQVDNGDMKLSENKCEVEKNIIAASASDYTPSSLEEAQSFSSYNLAVASSWLRKDSTNEVEQCLTESQRLWPGISMKTNHFLRLQTHLELCRGRHKNCLMVLSDLCGTDGFPLKHNIEA